MTVQERVIAMKLPNGNEAVVDLKKLTGYCLNPEHPRGKHKARVFASALGLTTDAVQEEATPAELDEYGQRYVVDFTMEGISGQAP